MYEALLAGYSGYLQSRHLVPEQHVRHYVRWVRLFLGFADKHPDGSSDRCLLRFLEELKKRPDRPEWQIGQAKNAVHMYYYQYRADDSEENRADDRLPEVDATDPAQVHAAMAEMLRLKHYRYRTEETYLAWMRRFYGFVERNRGARASPTAEDVRNFLTHLALERKVAASTQNQAFNALLFLCRHVIHLNLQDMDKNVRAKRGQKLPVVLSVDEVRALIVCTDEEHQLAVKLIYGGGLRVMDLCRLRVKDIDFDQNLLIIRDGKGAKDRATLLAESAKAELRKHLKKVRQLHDQDVAAGVGEVWLPDALSRKYPAAAADWGWQYVFPSDKLSNDPRSNKIRRHHIDASTVQRAVHRAVREAGIIKPASVHSLLGIMPLMPSSA